MKGLQEVTMHERKQLRRYCVRDYGGLPFTNMLRNYARVVTFVERLEKPSRRDEMPLVP
jgi:hypothetical protein